MNKWLRRVWDYTNFSRNTTLKIISILFSIMFWFYVMGDINPEVTTAIENLPVELLNVAELSESGLVIVGQTDFTAQVKITGRRNDVYKVSSEAVKISADTRGFQAGINSIPLEISVPASVRLSDFAPKQIKLELDRVVQKPKPVQILRVNRPLDGFTTEPPQVEPREVLVTGPESFVNTVEKVMGEIDIGGLTSPVSRNVALRAMDGDGKEVGGVSLGQAYAEVYLPVYRFGSLPVIPDLLGEAAEGYRIVAVEVEPQTVYLQGDQTALDALETISTEQLDISGISQSLETTVGLVVPEGLTAPYQTEPLKLTVRVEAVRTKELVMDAGALILENLEDGLDTNLAEIELVIAVKIRDVSSVLESINPANIFLTADLEGLGPGVHEVPIGYRDGEYLEVEISPEVLEIEIVEEEENQETQESGEGDRT